MNLKKFLGIIIIFSVFVISLSVNGSGPKVYINGGSFDGSSTNIEICSENIRGSGLRNFNVKYEIFEKGKIIKT